jgi:hypothetical protein
MGIETLAVPLNGATMGGFLSLNGEGGATWSTMGISSEGGT